MIPGLQLSDCLYMTMRSITYYVFYGLLLANINKLYYTILALTVLLHIRTLSLIKHDNKG